jgi:hypothetical protein
MSYKMMLKNTFNLLFKSKIHIAIIHNKCLVFQNIFKCYSVAPTACTASRAIPPCTRLF